MYSPSSRSMPSEMMMVMILMMRMMMIIVMIMMMRVRMVYTIRLVAASHSSEHLIT